MGAGDALFHEFFDMSLELLCIAGTDGYFHVLNPAWETVLGYTPDELTRRPFIEFVHPDDRANTVAEAARLATGTWETVSFLNRYRAKDGSYRWLQWSARLSGDGTRLLSVARDVSAHKDTETRLIAAIEAAEEANRAKSQFLANMSHELRTPLNSIIGFARLLGKNKDGALDDKKMTYLERIADNGVHLLRLINDILDLTRIEAGRLSVRPGDVDVAAVATRVVHNVASRAREKGLHLELECPPGLDPLCADDKRLEQVLINLVGNAIKFTDRGGVLVRVACHVDTPTRIDVVDTGRGIDGHTVDQLFAPFRQGDASSAREFGGTGLGLAIAKSLVELMGFRIAVASAPGVGSTFSVLLDADTTTIDHVPPTWQTGAEALVTRESVELDRKTVLLVGDLDARSQHEAAMAAMGYRVIATNSVSQAEVVAQRMRPDAVVLTADEDDDVADSVLRLEATRVAVVVATPASDGGITLLRALREL